MGSGPSEGDTEWGVGRFVLAVLLLAAVETVVTSLVRAVLPGWVAAVVTGLLWGLYLVLVAALATGLRGRQRPHGAGVRPLPGTVPVAPSPPRVGLRLAVGAVMGIPSAAAMALAGPMLAFDWPVALSFDEGTPRWVLAVGAPAVALLLVHEFVRDLHEVPLSRAVIEDILTGRAAHHRATVTRRGYEGLSVALVGAAAPPAEVTLAVSRWRRKSWDPLPGDEVLLEGDLHPRGLVLVTTADGSRWRWITSVMPSTSQADPGHAPNP